MKKKRNKKSFSDIIVGLTRIRKFYTKKDPTDPNSILSVLGYKRGINGKFTYKWPELLFLRMDLNEVSAFLLHIKFVAARRVVIMREEILGFTKYELNTRFHINNDQMTNFTNVDNLQAPEVKALIQFQQLSGKRQIVADINYPIEFLALISLLSRLPLQWLLAPEPDLTWNTEHFVYLNDVSLHYDKQEFSDFLNGLDHTSHDVRAVILTDLITKTKLYLRVEHLFGTLSIELCNTYASSQEYKMFIGLFQGEHYCYGLMPTVIPSQINHTVVMRHVLSKRPVCYPIEFIVKPPHYIE
ncbi:hypothetical protein [Paenibacillus phytohabitans]|uniref:hypothetical protein n=1 Tax=Paenibacillus phytohabitans TaxID=2654978 RepID=UPI00300B4470